MADLIRRVAVTAINRTKIFVGYWVFPIKNRIFPNLGSYQGYAHMCVRTLFSSSGIGIDNFKYARDQHATRYAPSLGKNCVSLETCR